jgi:hypothetical protein
MPKKKERSEYTASILVNKRSGILDGVPEFLEIRIQIIQVRIHIHGNPSERDAP